VDPIAHLGAENVIDEPVLRDPAEAVERSGGNDRVEVMAVAGDLGASSGNPGLDPLFQLFGSCTHSSSVARCGRYTE